MDDVTDEIRHRVNIVDLVGQRVSLKKAGKDFKGLCPFHQDKNPSFNVSPTLGRYRCWSCQESGDVFTWVMKTQNVEFREALELLAKIAGVELPARGTQMPPSLRASREAAMADALSFFQAELHKHTEAQAYCERRGLGPVVLATWEIGYAPEEGSALATHLRRKGHSLTECKNLFLVDLDSSGGYFDKFRGRLMFPIRDEKGDLVAFGGRLLGDGNPKYINSSDTPLYRKSRVVYGMNRAKESLSKERKAVLVEGYLDVIACHQAGVTGALASLGTALAEDQAKLLKRWCDGVTVLYDSDAAGQKAAERAIEILETEGLKVRVAIMPQGDDPDTLLRRDGAAAVVQASKNGVRPAEYRLELLVRSVGYQSDEFWPAAVQIAGEAPSEREMEQLLMKIAPHDPNIKDVAAATDRLRADAMVHRHRRLRTSSGVRAAVLAPKVVPLAPAERVVFLGFLCGSTRKEALRILKCEGLFETRAAEQLAAAVSSAFVEAPSGEPAEWLHLLEPPEMAQMLVDLDLARQPQPISAAFLLETEGTLRKKLESRELRALRAGNKNDEAKVEYLTRLRKLKGD